MFNCTEIEGKSYLSLDTSIICYDDRYNGFVPLGLCALFLYPIGIPLVFLAMLAFYRHRLSQAEVYSWLGFLYAGYTRSMPFFELLDMAVKLFLYDACFPHKCLSSSRMVVFDDRTSVLLFIPIASRLSLALSVLGCYFIIILLTAPYLRCAVDCLQLIVLTELYLIVLTSHTLNRNASDASTSAAIDTLLSLLLLAIVLVAVLLFVCQLLMHFRRQARKAQRVKMLALKSAVASVPASQREVAGYEGKAAPEIE
jgi:hypothetical protein